MLQRFRPPDIAPELGRTCYHPGSYRPPRLMRSLAPATDHDWLSRMGHFDNHSFARLLNAAGFRAEVRGDDAARFVFAQAGARATEISASDAGVWVEYWDGDDSPSVDRTFPNADAAIADAKAWLSGDAR